MSALPAPDAIEGAPHPRDTAQLFGQAKAEAQFMQAFDAGRLHSGWLLTGPRGVGKATLAYRIAAFLLADMGGGLFGGGALTVDRDGPDMRQILAGAHPRLCVITRGPNATGSALSDVITLDQLRKIKSFFHMSSADGGRRVVIVDAADEMNRSAANALLKELEEPPAQSTLLLISHQPSRLLPTIRSRCRVLRCAPLGPQDMTRALDQAGFADASGPALGALSGGSVGDAIRLLELDGLALYQQMVALMAPKIDRQAAASFANSMTGKAADGRYGLMMDLLDKLMARLARSGLHGPPSPEAAPGEAQVLARLAPHDLAARDWADLAAALQERLRHGRAVNIDPGALTLDALLRIEATARRHA